MTDTYMFLIRQKDWDSDRYLPGGEPADDVEMAFSAHKAFQAAVTELGARIVGGNALQSATHGGIATPGEGAGRRGVVTQRRPMGPPSRP